MSSRLGNVCVEYFIVFGIRIYEGKRPRDRHKRRWPDDIKMEIEQKVVRLWTRFTRLTTRKHIGIL
jgi:hypothetical protein